MGKKSMSMFFSLDDTVLRILKAHKNYHFVWVWKPVINDKTGDVTVYLTERDYISQNALTVEFAFKKEKIIELLEKNCRHSRFAQITMEGVLARRIAEREESLRRKAAREWLLEEVPPKLIPTVNPNLEKYARNLAMHYALAEVFRSAIRYDNFYGRSPSETRDGFNLQKLFIPNYARDCSDEATVPSV